MQPLPLTVLISHHINLSIGIEEQISIDGICKNVQTELELSYFCSNLSRELARLIKKCFFVKLEFTRWSSTLSKFSNTSLTNALFVKYLVKKKISIERHKTKQNQNHGVIP